ncbi:hypothetical protein THER_2051 [Thermodesulfovibrio sp. N1]|nr:hypothetical protein THER_2051 [Thermodesulfovibrio sp. N1]
MEIFCNLNEEGKTIIMVTHDIDLTKKTKKIIKMLDGRIID